MSCKDAILATILSAAAIGCGDDARETADPQPEAVALRTVTYTAGPSWDPALPPEEQDLAAHFGYIGTLFESGSTLGFGPFLDDGRGFYVHLEDAVDAQALVDDDPAVQSGVLALDEVGTWQLSLDALGSDVGSDSLFVLNYTPGVAWESGRPISEQALGPHSSYVGSLFESGELLAGGIVSSEQGRYVVAAPDSAAAAALVSDDPSVQSELFAVEVKPWAPFQRQSVTDARAR